MHKFQKKEQICTGCKFLKHRSHGQKCTRVAICTPGAILHRVQIVHMNPALDSFLNKFEILLYFSTSISLWNDCHIKNCKFTVFSTGSFWQVTEEALIAETAVWSNFFLWIFSLLLKDLNFSLLLNVKLENKSLEQRILINNCLAPFDSEYIDFGGYPIFSILMTVSAKYLLEVHFKYLKKCLMAWFLSRVHVHNLHPGANLHPEAN